MNPNEYCKQKVLNPGTDLYYSLLFLSENKKAAAIALHALQKEIYAASSEYTNEDVAKTKLNWWHDEVQRLFNHQARHPITQALQPYLEQYKLKQEYLNEIIIGATMNLEYNSYRTFDDLYHYCFRAASILHLLLIEVFSYQSPQTQEYAKHIGIAFQLTTILRNIRKDAENGRIYIPLDELEHFKVKQTDLGKTLANTETSALFAFQAKRITEFHEKAFSALANNDRSNLRSNIILARINQALLKEIEKDGFKLLQQRIELTPLRKLWIAWRCH